jgi:hypothetical protein
MTIATLEAPTRRRLSPDALARKYGYSLSDSILDRAAYHIDELTRRIKASTDPAEALRLAERYDRRVADREWLIRFGLAAGVLVSRKGRPCFLRLDYDAFEDELSLIYEDVATGEWHWSRLGALHQAEVPDCLAAKLAELRNDYPYDPELGW